MTKIQIKRHPTSLQSFLITNIFTKKQAQKGQEQTTDHTQGQVPDQGETQEDAEAILHDAETKIEDLAERHGSDEISHGVPLPSCPSTEREVNLRSRTSSRSEGKTPHSLVVPLQEVPPKPNPWRAITLRITSEVPPPIVSHRLCRQSLPTLECAPKTSGPPHSKAVRAIS